MGRALRRDTRLAEAHYYAGPVYLEQKELDPRPGDFAPNSRFLPGDPHTMYDLAYTLLFEDQLPESIGLVRQVVKAMPDCEPAYFELGRALL